MAIPTIYDLCRPRADILEGTIVEAGFAADLAQVLSGEATPEYGDAARFFANTYPTRGLKKLLADVSKRLSGREGGASANYRLDTSYGGGKTHGLIALVHAAQGMRGVEDPEEFVNPELLPEGPVRVAAFDGEHADPANGRTLEGDLRAYTPWGELAYALAGREGYERVRQSDRERTAPGASTLRELFGGEPTLILLDELAIYLRKAGKFNRGQLTAFMSSLSSAVEGSANACVVYTLAIGKDHEAIDAYMDEHNEIAEAWDEMFKTSARKATPLNPTEEDETVHVLRRRLFESVDEARIGEVVDAYAELWRRSRESLSGEAVLPETVESFRAGYPFHPEVLETLTAKTATLNNFQRVRGMLRLLGKAVGQLWSERPGDAAAIHLHHIDPGHEPIRDEIFTKLGQHAYRPAISGDISSGVGAGRALAEEIDAAHFEGMPPCTEYVARTVLLHSLAFNEGLKGVAPDQLRFSMLGPGIDLPFIDDARERFVARSAYLDDRPGAPMRFSVEANLLHLVRQEMGHVDRGEAREQLKDQIRDIFVDHVFQAVHFPGGPFDLPDDVGDGRPRLAVMSYDGSSVVGTDKAEKDPPRLVERFYARKGGHGQATRERRNNLVFVVADGGHVEAMQAAMRRRLALRALVREDRLRNLAKYQREQLRELEKRSVTDLAVAIQTCYRHIFYPSRGGGAGQTDLAHTSIEEPKASFRPGAGQAQVVRVLQDLGKLRRQSDGPDSPRYLRDVTPLKNKGEMTTAEFRDQFRRNTKLPILIGDDVFIRGIRTGVEQKYFVYRSGDLLYGPGDPAAEIRIDEQSTLMTMAFAKDKKLWPRSEPHPVTPPPPPPPTPPPPPETSVSSEGLFRSALKNILDAAASKGWEAIAELRIRPFEYGDGFRLLGPVGTLSLTDSKIRINGNYETRDMGAFEWTFNGPISDAKPIKEFLEPRLKIARECKVDIQITLRFGGGLAVGGRDADKLVSRLTRSAEGTVHIEALRDVRDGSGG